MIFSQAERLKAKIESDIVTNKFRPGERLDENRLAEMYGTSRTPVREALRQLSSSGLVELRPHRGAVVAKLDTSAVMELFEVMAELEGACGRRAAEGCTQEDMDRILEAQEICIKSLRDNDVELYKEGNEKFHDAIYNASANNALIKLTFNIRNRIAPYRRMRIQHVNRLAKYSQEHEEIIQAIRDGRAEDADQFLRTHLLNISRDVPRLASITNHVESDGRIRIANVPSRLAEQYDPVAVK